MFQGQNTQDKPTDNIKQFNIYATGVLRTRKENGTKDIWRNNGLKLSKFGEKYYWNKNLRQIPSRINTKKIIARHIIIKVLKTKGDKKEVFKTAKERRKDLHTGEQSSRTMKARGQRNNNLLKC